MLLCELKQKRYRYPELWNADLRLALLRYRHPELCNTALRLALLRYRYPELWNADLRLALLRYILHAELPDPGGVFAGTFRSAIAPLTFAALANGFLQVPDSVRARLDKLERVELCVFLAAELEAFQKAHHDILASQPDSSLMMRHQTGRFSHVITMINMVSNRINSAARQVSIMIVQVLQQVHRGSPQAY
eukprot:g52661.t1